MASSSQSSRSGSRSKQITTTYNTYNANKKYRNQMKQAEKNQPVYTDAYKGMKGAIVNQLENGGFEADLSSGVYQDYSNDYRLLGAIGADQAMQTTEDLSGGYGTTYSGNVAQQGLDSYLANEKNIVPAMIKAEKQSKQQDVANLINKGSLVSNLSSQEQERYQNKLAMWNNNREYAYNKFINDYQMSAKEHQKTKGSESSWENTSSTSVTSGGGRSGSRTPKSIPKSALKSKESAAAWLKKNGYSDQANNIMSMTGDMDDDGFAAQIANMRLGSYVGYSDDTEEGKKEKKRLQSDYSDYLLTYIRQAMGLEDENYFEKEQKRQNKARRKYYGY